MNTIEAIAYRAWKSQDFNGVWTHDLATPVRRSNWLSYEAPDVGHLWILCEEWMWSDKRNCLSCVHNCDDHSLLDFKSAVLYMKPFIYHFTRQIIVTHNQVCPLTPFDIMVTFMFIGWSAKAIWTLKRGKTRGTLVITAGMWFLCYFSRCYSFFWPRLGGVWL